MNTVLSFDVGDRDRVDRLTDEAVTRGARLMKPPTATFFGQYQSTLLDREGNAFRITAAA